MTTVKKYRVTFSLILSLIMIFTVFQTVQISVSAKGSDAGAEAAEWAIKIAKDNSFNYGPVAKDGCYFCKSRKDKLYCCNSFAVAAYTHGAKIYKKCGHTSLKPNHWTDVRHFKYIRKNPKVSQLIPGDILLRERHVMIYVGNGNIAEARSKGMDNGSIRVIAYSKVGHHKELKQYRYKSTTTSGVKEFLKSGHNYDGWDLKTKATPSKPGEYQRKCSVCGKVDKKPIYSPTKVTISKKVYTYTGKAIKPTVTVKDSKKKTISSKYYKITYSNNTAVGTGTAKIAFSGIYSGSVTLPFDIIPVSVQAPPVAETIMPTGVSLNKIKAHILTGQSVTLLATILPGNATETDLIWNSSNPSVATVKDGLVSSLEPGTTVITVMTTNNKIATCEVNVL